MNILISGATGYLGSNILENLSGKNNISVLDRGYNIVNPQEYYDVFLYFSNPNEIDFAKNAYNSIIDMVTHYYSITSVLDKLKIKSLLYASTVRVHDYVRNTYANSHLFIEGLLENYTTGRNIKFTKARFGNVFGGSIHSMLKRHTLVPHVFIKEAISRNKIVLRIDGAQYRDFTPMCVVHKYIDYIIRCKPLEIDICTGHTFQILEIVKIFNGIFVDLKVEFSKKNLKEKVKNYKSAIEVTKLEVKKEIINTIDKWKLHNASNFE